MEKLTIKDWHPGNSHWNGHRFIPFLSLPWWKWNKLGNISVLYLKYQWLRLVNHIYISSISLWLICDFFWVWNTAPIATQRTAGPALCLSLYMLRWLGMIRKTGRAAGSPVYQLLDPMSVCAWEKDFCWFSPFGISWRRCAWIKSFRTMMIHSCNL